MYCAELKNMNYARRILDDIPDPNVVIYNSVFKGYAQNEQYRDLISLFSQMMKVDVKPNCYTFPMVLKSLAKVSALREGQEVHCWVIKNGFKSEPFVGTTLIDMYSSGGESGQAYKVFGEMPVRNVVAWTSIINGFIICHNMNLARRLFELAPARDTILWNTMVSGYIEAGDLAMARNLFDRMPNKDVMSWNTMLSGYVDNGDMDACEKLFEEIPTRNVFSWNVLIGGYGRHGHFSEALNAFKRMLVESDVCPNNATLVAALSACTRLGALDLGKWLHVYAESIGYTGNVYVENALIDMYAKCGLIESASNVFKSMAKKDLISWNTIIGGLAMHGHAADALALFAQMQTAGVKPDAITFIGVLSACTHLGLVEDGFSYFQSMADYSVAPEIEHYGCMVDMYARAGLLHQAIEFVREMPMEADGVIWASLLGACRIHKNVELAELALERLIELEPENPSNYLMLSNIYGGSGNWKKASTLKVAMRGTGFRKVPGCSLIEVNDRVVEFYSLDERHPEKEEIYRCLRSLIKQIRSFGYEKGIVP
ncbi:hypothetical protein Nepgr_003741 [Nepenthes gracilis]|uniref:Chlororespiratory reduction 4 n=1 Tax=Nepenthes gracilis TaxID=150966 RepID=A0AAD3XE65_NEPGR|nr:hypothetical protein Nepgr_003741 [Nepenthes gracilis]